jgi:hypothetical protein
MATNDVNTCNTLEGNWKDEKHMTMSLTCLKFTNEEFELVMLGTSPSKDTKSTYLKLEDTQDDWNDKSDGVRKKRREKMCE